HLQNIKLKPLNQTQPLIQIQYATYYLTKIFLLTKELKKTLFKCFLIKLLKQSKNQQQQNNSNKNNFTKENTEKKNFKVNNNKIKLTKNKQNINQTLQILKLLKNTNQN